MRWVGERGEELWGIRKGEEVMFSKGYVAMA